MKFILYDREEGTLVEGVMQFQYLGRTLEETDSDWPAVHQKTRKMRLVWRRLGKLLQWEGEYSQVSDLFYRAMTQAVLLLR